MSIMNDKSYIGILSVRLQNFKWLDKNKANCSCPICGDSRSNKTKARLYFLPESWGYVVYCHNCGYNSNFFDFLKRVDVDLHKKYVLDNYKNGRFGNKFHANNVIKSYMNVSTPSDRKINIMTNTRLIDGLMDRVNTLPEDHIAVQYVKNRKIPKDTWNRIYFIDDMRKVGQLSDNYKDKIVTSEPRVVFPSFDRRGFLVGLSCRAMGDEKLRYVAVKIKEDQPPMFGFELVDFNKEIFVVEGPIDSLFLNNSVAVSGSALKNATKVFPKATTTYVFDNQPRNKEILKLMYSMIDRGFKLVIWPENLDEKDINDLVLSGFTRMDVYDIIVNNTYQGLQAKLQFMKYKKVGV